MMKKTLAALVTALLLCVAALGLAATEHSFALVAKDKVNLRRTPGGQRILYLGKGTAVLVLGTEQAKGKTWHRVYVSLENDHVTHAGYVDAAMLTDVRDAYSDVVQAAVGDRHVLLRHADGRVSAFGFPFFDNLNVSGWPSMTDIAASRFLSAALRADGTVAQTNAEDLHPGSEGWRNVRALVGNPHGGDPLAALTADGAVLYGQNLASLPEWRDLPAEAGNAKQLVFGEKFIAWLTEAGEVHLGIRGGNPQGALLAAAEGQSGVRKIAAGENCLLLLMADGTVRLFGALVDDTDVALGWTDIVDIAAARQLLVGVREDGTVVSEGVMVSVDKHSNSISYPDRFVRLADTALYRDWRDVVRVFAGPYILVGLCADGHIEAATVFRYDP